MVTWEESRRNCLRLFVLIRSKRLSTKSKKIASRQTGRHASTLKIVSYCLYILGAAIIPISLLLLLPTSLNVVTVPSPESCSVSVTTVTGVNGTHRNFVVSCSETMSISQGNAGNYPSGIQIISSAFTSMFAVLSIVSSIGFAITTILFQGEDSDTMRRKDTAAFFLLTMLTFSLAIVLTLLFSVIEPLNGLSPSRSGLYLLLFSTLGGLSFSLLTLAGVVHERSTRLDTKK